MVQKMVDGLSIMKISFYILKYSIRISIGFDK